MIISLKKASEIKGKVVTTVGVFDVFHYGHVIALEEAKKQGDVLIVGVNSDETIKKYKSKYRPIYTEKERIKIVDALGCVDYVVKMNCVRPLKFLKKIKPDVHAQSEEYGLKYEEARFVKSYGGKVHLLKRKGKHSTSYYIDKIRKLPKHEKKKLA